MAWKRYGLSAAERLKSKKDFERIFAASKPVYSSDNKVRGKYIIEKTEKQPVVKIAAAVSTKLGSAVWRNRIKRLIRESYRQNKIDITEYCKEKKVNIKIVFSPHGMNQKSNKNAKLNDFMPGVIEILRKIKNTDL